MRKDHYEGLITLPRQPVEDIHNYKICPTCETAGRAPDFLTNHDCRGCRWDEDLPKKNVAGKAVTLTSYKVL